MAIETIAETLLEKLRSIAQTDTVVGKPIESGGSVVVPVSRVTVGFGMGGHSGKSELASSGGGIRVDPVAFLVLKGDSVRVLPVGRDSSLISKITDMAPDLVTSALAKFASKPLKKTVDAAVETQATKKD
jgi:uncharacterized spore protein YtfJ